MRILLVGCSGNLGTVVYQLLIENHFEVKCAVRAENPKNTPYVVPFENIENLQGFIPEIVINLSNFYTQDSSPTAITNMRSSIVGVATAIARANSNLKAKIIYTSTYFQYCPKEMQPWSNYAELKKDALAILENSSKMTDTNLTNFVLYDNYGGHNKSKIFDLLLKAISLKEEFNTTKGEQILNLTHINDVASAILLECLETAISKNTQFHNYDLRGEFTIKLRDLASLISKLVEISPKINWGASKYRDKEVFQLWDSEFELPSYWERKESIEDYIIREYEKYIKVGN